jgi:hypothetical protein
MMRRMCSVQQALLVVGVLQTASGALLVDSGMLVGWGSAKPDVLSMVCYPASCSGESAADTVVHSIVKSDAWVSERTTINSMAYPASDVPKALALSACVNVSEGEDYSPGVETFSMTFVAAGMGAYTEVGGDLFTARTNLVRRDNLIVGNTEGLVATHDTFDLSDNWDLNGQKTPWGITYDGPTRFFQQFYLFPTGVTLDLGAAQISVGPCDLLHLFHFVRAEGNSEVATSADWKFRQEGKEGFSQRDFVLTGALSLRHVDNQTIAVEAEKEHFLSMTRAPAGHVNLPEYVDAATGKTYVRIYEWKSQVYCSSNTDDTTVLASLTGVTDATFEAALETYVDPTEAQERGLTGWSHTEPASGDRAAYKLNFWHIPSDRRPLIYKTDPNGHDFDHIHLNLKWRNLPSVAECPVLVWDPTFHALPASPSRRQGQGPGAISVGVRDLPSRFALVVLALASFVITAQV